MSVTILSPLTMIKLEPDMGRLIRWAARRGLIARRGEDDLGYPLHALMAAVFGKEAAPKPFVLLQEPRRPAALLAYSNEAGDALRRLAQATAEPDAAEAIGLDGLSAKAMPESWAAGQRFGFRVRVRPVRRTDRDGDRRRAREVDAALLEQDRPKAEVYETWLRAHVAGAEIEQASLEAFRLSDVRRRDGERSLVRQRGPDATFVGTLRVTDGPAFAATLARGVGRHRAFGFGMLLLRPGG